MSLPATSAAPGSEWRCCKVDGGMKWHLHEKHWHWDEPAEWLVPRRLPRKRLSRRLKALWRRLTRPNGRYGPPRRYVASSTAVPDWDHYKRLHGGR